MLDKNAKASFPEILHMLIIPTFPELGTLGTLPTLRFASDITHISFHFHVLESAGRIGTSIIHASFCAGDSISRLYCLLLTQLCHALIFLHSLARHSNPLPYFHGGCLPCHTTLRPWLLMTLAMHTVPSKTSLPSAIARRLPQRQRDRSYSKS